MGPGPFPELVEIVVEIPRGSRNKYEYDEQAGVYRLDRVLSARLLQLRLRVHRGDPGRRRRPHRRPADHRRADVHRLPRLGATDRRPRDARREGRRLQDPVRRDRRPAPAAHRAARPGAPHRLVEIEHFFETYKLLEDKTVEVLGWRERDRALEILRSDRATWERETGAADLDDGAAPAIPGREDVPAAGCSSPSRCRPKRGRGAGRLVTPSGRRRPGAREVRWVRLDGLHVTLRFLGPTLEARSRRARGGPRRRDARAPFEVGLGGGGRFPSATARGRCGSASGRARTSWRRWRRSSTRARRGRLGRRGASVPSAPHAARSDGVRARRGGRRGDRSAAAGTCASAGRVDRVVLFGSVTGGGPARYEPLEKAPLGRPAEPAGARAPIAVAVGPLRARLASPGPATRGGSAVPTSMEPGMSPVDPRRTKFVLDEAGSRGPGTTSRPTCPSPPRRPSTRAPASRSARRPRAALPDGADRPGGQHRARDRDPRAGPRGLPPVPARARSSGRTGWRRRSIRRPTSTTSTRACSPAGSHKPNTAIPQAFYNKEEGVTRHRDRDRRRPVGQRARVRRRAVRPRGQGLHGPRELRPEAVPPDPDGDLRRRGRAQPDADDELRPRGPGGDARLPGLAGHGDQRGGRGRRDARRHQVLARLGAQPRAAPPDGHRPGGDRADGDGRRGAGRRHRLRRRRLELRRADVPVPRPQLPRGRQVPGHRRRARGGARP